MPLDDIAAHAGVGPGTLHRHFPRKSALLTAVLLVELKERVSEAEAVATASDPGRELYRLLTHMVADGTRSKALKETLTAAGVNLRDIAPEAHVALSAALTQALTAAQRTGAVRADIDARDLLSLLAGALAATAHAQLNGRPADRCTSLMLDALRPT